MAEIKVRFESMFTSLQRSEAAGLIVSGQLRRLWQRRVRCGGQTTLFSWACHEGFVTDVSDGDSPSLAKVLGRLQSVEASLASLTISFVGEQAAEDVEESVQAIDLVRGCVRRWNASRERQWQALSVKRYTPCLVGRRPRSSPIP